MLLCWFDSLPVHRPRQQVLLKIRILLQTPFLEKQLELTETHRSVWDDLLALRALRRAVWDDLLLNKFSK